MATITAEYPAGIIGSTAANLKEAAEGEQMEWGTLYPDFADIAEKEGFIDVANSFRNIAKVESRHERRYRILLNNLEKKQVFKRDKSVLWKCRNCGYIHEGTAPPNTCPACQHPQSYYEIFTENY